MIMPNNHAEQKKVIWFKKAKCAGTSFESVLQEAGIIYYVDKSTTLRDLENPHNKVICIREALFPYGGTPVRMPAGDYKIAYKSTFMFKLRRYFGIPFEPKYFMFKYFPEFLKKYPKFAVFRNPYDKFISSWKYLKSTKHMAIDEVIKDMPSHRNFHDWIHITQQQIDCVRDRQGNVVIDQFVYMESDFNNDINDILEYIDMEPINMPVKNRSKRTSYQQYLTSEISEKIRNLYKDDFAILGYSDDININYPVQKHKGVHLDKTFLK